MDRYTHEYDDIIMLPHFKSKKRPAMSNHDRAAQFAPFAALTGFDAQIKETARLTDSRLALDDESVFLLNERLQILHERIDDKPVAEITYFVPDGKKHGGSYVTISGNVRRIDDIVGEIIFTDERKIPINDVYSIKGEIFDLMENSEEYGT